MADLLSYIREGRTMSQSEKLRLIVNLSVPSILAQISATVMFFIDASMVGHLGAKASAAIGLVETTGWLMGGLASAANMGFSVQVAHAIGANDFGRARKVLRQSIMCCLLWSLLMSVICIAISYPLPYWLGGSEEIAHDASLYFAIIGFCGIFFQMEGLAGKHRSISIGAAYAADKTEDRKMIKEKADELMYNEKERYYKGRHDRRR